METPSHCTVSAHRKGFDLVCLSCLTFAVLLVHGYHPWAEDGGLYVAGVEYTLNPSLFPYERAFVTEHLSYSVFAPVIASLVRLSHLSLAAVLFDTYLLSVGLMLFAALRLARSMFPAPEAQWTALALLAAWWSLPIAGTSLLLMDPYLTARSLSTPLSLIAIAEALRPWGIRHASRNFRVLPAAITCLSALVLAALFHPLMAGYTLAFILFVRLSTSDSPPAAKASIPALGIAAAAIIQWHARPETPAQAAAAYSRYYWFLSQWHWFEVIGLFAPLSILALARRFHRGWLKAPGRALCDAGIVFGLTAGMIALLFAQEHYRAHAVARLQPLRCLLLIYILMILICGGALQQVATGFAVRFNGSGIRRAVVALPILFTLVMALTMFFVQRQQFPGSIHVELPGRANPNPWVEAFLWARHETPEDALFAMDARYINTRGEDAQTFRAIAQRSAIPDFSKDGGEAAIAPRLAAAWRRSVLATCHLSTLADPERDATLRPFAVQWVILHADASTSHACPYRNAVVKVCRIP